jgi:hypothetical protein
MEQLVQSLRPGGYGLMVVDFVSTETLPELLLVKDDDDDKTARIEQLAEKAEQSGNFFHGTKRQAVVQALQSSSRFENLVEHVQLGPPWKWTLKKQKQYIVYSVLFRRKQS